MFIFDIKGVRNGGYHRVIVAAECLSQILGSDLSK